MKKLLLYVLVLCSITLYAQEFGTNDFRISDAGGVGVTNATDAFAPHGAYNSTTNQYLVVWEADDTDFFPIIDNEKEIIGQFIDANGAEIGVDFIITTHGGVGNGAFDANEPKVVYNSTNNEFLVVYSADVVGNSGEEEIYGQRLDATGGLLGSAFQISTQGPNGNTAYDAFDPDVAYNATDNQYLVVWNGDENSNEDEIYGQLLLANGAEFGGDFKISTQGIPFDAADALVPKVAWNSTDNEYLVVWTGDVPGFPGEDEIYGQLLSNFGTEIGGDFRISDMSIDGSTAEDALDPAVSYNPIDNEYLVVWEGDDQANLFEIYGQRLSNTGLELGANDFRISFLSQINPGYDAANPEIVYQMDTGSYFVVWQGDSALVNDEDIFMMEVSNLGSLVGIPIPLTSTDAGNSTFDALDAAIVSNGNNGLLISFEADFASSGLVVTGGEEEIHIQMFGNPVITSPEINIVGNTQSILDGDSTPSITDDTDFGNINVVGNDAHTFTIDNTAGTGDLSVSSIVSTGTHAADFVVGGISTPATVTAGTSTTFTLTFSPGALGLRSATITVNNDDADESVYDFAVQGIGELVLADQSVTVSPNSSICQANAVVSLASSQLGVNYYLRDNADDSLIEGPVSGTGASIDFTSESISATKTYNVLAKAQAYGLNFDGIDKYVQVTRTGLGLAGHTLEAWINTTSVATGGGYAGNTALNIIGDHTNNIGMSFGVDAGKLQYNHFNGAWNVLNGLTTVNDGEWHHVAVVHEATGLVSLYVDGILDNDGVITLTTNTNYTAYDTFGASYLDGIGYQDHFDGLIDEVRSWSSPRTDVEITNNMLNCLTGAEANLVGYYNFEDGVNSPILSDLTAANNTGTLVNIDPAADWQFATDICTAMSLQMTNLPIVTINPIPDETVTVSPTSGVCSANAVVSLAASELGLTYWLRDNGDNSIVDGPVAGTGSQIDFNSENISATKTYNVLATKGAALDFDGTDDFLTVPTDLSLDFTGDFTIEAIIKESGSALAAIFSQYEVAQKRIELQVIGTNQLQLVLSGDGVTNDYWITSDDPIDTNAWNHVAAVYEAGVGVTLYINGDVAPSTANGVIPTALFATSSITTIGASRQGLGSPNFYTGQIEELRVWNDIRTLSEIQDNVINTLTGAEANLVANWSFEDGIGNTTALDKTANNNTATLSANMDAATDWVSGLFGTCELIMTNTPTVTITNPEMDVQGLLVSITSGDTTPDVSDATDFGMVIFGTHKEHPFVIENTGDAILDLVGLPLVSITGSTDFTITTDPATSVATAGGTTTFVVRYTPSAAGTINTATISIANSDCDEDPYTFDIRGTSVGPVLVNPKVYLQGAALSPSTGEETLMRDDLRVAGLLPTTSPYADAAVANASVFNTGGTSGTGAVADDIVDWVWVELRDEMNNTIIYEGHSALLQRDGDIVTVDGLSSVSFLQFPYNYFVSIKHRNHLGIMTASPIALSDITTSVDYSNAAAQITFGTNAQSTFGMQAGVVGMWAGNVNGDIFMTYQGASNDTNTIKDNVLADAGTADNLHSYSAYDSADVDMDGTIIYQGANNDSNRIKDVVLSHPDNGTASNLFVITEQLPEN